MVTEYRYSELKNAAVAFGANKKAIDELGEWFQRFGTNYWNGEYFDAGEFRLYPVYKEEENGDFTLAGFEIR